jgi:hypothetical protein
LLASGPLRFLRCDAAFLEPTQEITPVEVDAPLASDDLGDTSSRPEVGGEAERLGILAEPAKDLSLLAAREFAGPGRRRFGVEPGFTVFSEGGLPAVDGSFRDIEKLGDFGDGVSVLKFGDREFSPPMKFGSRAGWSHARSYAGEKEPRRGL